MRVSDRLTDIAELIVKCCMDLHGSRYQTHVLFVAREPRSRAHVKVAVGRYGKLGGWNSARVGSRSVFLHDQQANINRARCAPVDNGVFS